jgi:putative transposase
MVRPLRFEIEDAVYHITARGNERKDIFIEEEDKKKFIALLSELPGRFGVNLHAYVLMSNHYHLLIETPKGNISKAMHYLNVSYTVYFNRKNGRSGHLLQGRYKSFIIEKESYLLAVSRYIHLNPVRARVVGKPEDYRWSSYRSYIGKGNGSKWLTTDWMLEQFSNDKKTARRLYREFVKEGVGKEDDPFSGIFRGGILGSVDFMEKIKSRIDVARHGSRPFIKSLMLPGREIDEILKQVAEHFKVREEDLLRKGKRNNIAKKVFMFLLRQGTGLTNEEIGKRFGVDYTAVSQAVARVKREMEENAELKKKVISLEQRLFKGSGDFD